MMALFSSILADFLLLSFTKRVVFNINVDLCISVLSFFKILMY